MLRLVGFCEFTLFSGEPTPSDILRLESLFDLFIRESTRKECREVMMISKLN